MSGFAFSDPVIILLNAIAAHDRCDDIGALILSLAERRAGEIGLTALFRAAVSREGGDEARAPP